MHPTKCTLKSVPQKCILTEAVKRTTRKSLSERSGEDIEEEDEKGSADEDEDDSRGSERYPGRFADPESQGLGGTGQATENNLFNHVYLLSARGGTGPPGVTGRSPKLLFGVPKVGVALAGPGTRTAAFAEEASENRVVIKTWKITRRVHLWCLVNAALAIL